MLQIQPPSRTLQTKTHRHTQAHSNMQLAHVGMVLRHQRISGNAAYASQTSLDCDQLLYCLFTSGSAWLNVDMDLNLDFSFRDRFKQHRYSHNPDMAVTL